MNTQILSPVGALRGRRMARCFTLALMTLIAGAAAAADFGDRTPSVADLVDALNVRSVEVGDQVTAARSDSVRTRGLKFVAHGESVAGSSASVAAPAAKASAPLAGRVSLRIQFDLNSDRVLGGSAISLGNLAAALNSDALKGAAICGDWSYRCDRFLQLQPGTVGAACALGGRVFVDRWRRT